MRSLDVNGKTQCSATEATEWEQQQDGARHAAAAAAQPPAVILHRIDSTAHTHRFYGWDSSFTSQQWYWGPKTNVRCVNQRWNGRSALTLCILLIVPAERSEEQGRDKTKRQTPKTKSWWQELRWMAFLSGFVRWCAPLFWLQNLLGGEKGCAPFRSFFFLLFFLSALVLCHSRVGRDFFFFFGT